MKQAVKKLLGAVSASQLLRPLALRQFQARTNVVYYHSVGLPTPYYSAFSGGCTFERFQYDFERLAEVFRFASLEQVCEANSRVVEQKGPPLLAVLRSMTASGSTNPNYSSYLKSMGSSRRVS